MNWSKEIAQASTLEGVFAVMNEYLDVSARKFRDEVPPGTLPALVRSGKDLEEWQAHLVAAVTQNAARTTPAVIDQGYLLLHAMARAIEIEHLAPAGGATSKH